MTMESLTAEDGFVYDSLREPLPWVNKINPKLVIGLTGSNSYRAAVTGYGETGLMPHATIDLTNRSVHVHVGFEGASHMYPAGHPLAPHRSSKAFYVNITRNSGDIISADEAVYLSMIIEKMCEALNVPFDILDGPGSISLAHKEVLTASAFSKYSGVVNDAVSPDGKRLSSFTLDWLMLPEAPKPEEASAPVNKKPVRKKASAKKAVVPAMPETEVASTEGGQE